LSRRAVDALFQALFALTDLRALLRETAPLHEMSAEQREQAVRSIETAKKQIAILEQEMLR